MHLKMPSCNVKNDAIRTISESHMMIEIIVVYIHIYVMLCTKLCVFVFRELETRVSQNAVFLVYFS